MQLTFMLKKTTKHIREHIRSHKTAEQERKPYLLCAVTIQPGI